MYSIIRVVDHSGKTYHVVDESELDDVLGEYGADVAAGDTEVKVIEEHLSAEDLEHISHQILLKRAEIGASKWLAA